MHAGTESMLQARFVNKLGVKISDTSYTFTLKETAQKAQRAAFEIASVREMHMRR